MVLSPSRRRGVTEVDSQWGVSVVRRSGGWGDGGCGGWSWCVCWWVGESAVGTGISTLSHRVSVQPSTTAEHTTLDSSAHTGRTMHTHTHSGLNSQGHTVPTLECTHTLSNLPRGLQGHPKQVSTDGGLTETRGECSTSQLYFHPSINLSIITALYPSYQPFVGTVITEEY